MSARPEMRAAAHAPARAAPAADAPDAADAARPGTLRGWDCHVHVFESGAPTLPGHYAPPAAPLAAIEREAAALGIGHLVIVQPSVYGSDNAVLERALCASGGRHRGIAVLDADVGEATLDRLHAAGVRGVRYNRVSPVGNDSTGLPALAPRLRARGWHVQWYATPAQLPHIAALQAATGLTFVLDHMAGLRADAPVEPATWKALHRLADAGAWVKLSGWYRLGAEPPYDAVRPLLRQVAALFGARLLWGSDWPHTSLPALSQSRLPGLLAPLREALGPEACTAVLEGAGALYGAMPPG